MLFSVVLLLFLWSCQGLQCPPAHEIWPCVCTVRFTVTVRCEGAPNFDSVQATLGQHFSHIPYLKLHRVHAHSLPRRALGDLSLSRLSITGSSLRRVDEAAFAGQGNRLGLLSLADNRLEEVPVEPLLELSGLKTLSLIGNFLMRIPAGSFQNLTELGYLFLADNRISSLERGAFPEDLGTLSLSRNLLPSLNGSLLRLRKLGELYLDENRLADLEYELEDLGGLKLLHLQHNHLTRVDKALKSLHHLEELNLDYNRIRSIGKVLESLPNLKKLSLAHNFISELPPSHLVNLRNLKALDLSGNYLKFACDALKPLSRLEELHLSDTGLEELNFSCFKGMDRLQVLDLSENRIKTVLFHHPLKGLLSLNLSGNRITTLKHGLGSVSGSLVVLDISRNSFTSLKLPHQLFLNRYLTLKIEGNPFFCSEHLKRQLESLEESKIVVYGKPLC